MQYHTSKTLLLCLYFILTVPVYYPVLYNILSVSITLSMGEGYENHLWRALFSALVVGESEIEHRDASCVFSPPGVPSVGCLGREYGNWLRSGSMEEVWRRWERAHSMTQSNADGLGWYKCKRVGGAYVGGRVKQNGHEYLLLQVHQVNPSSPD